MKFSLGLYFRCRRLVTKLKSNEYVCVRVHFVTRVKVTKIKSNEYVRGRLITKIKSNEIKVLYSTNEVADMADFCTRSLQEVSIL